MNGLVEWMDRWMVEYVGRWMDEQVGGWRLEGRIDGCKMNA